MDMHMALCTKIYVYCSCTDCIKSQSIFYNAEVYVCPDVANPGSTFIYHQIAYTYMLYNYNI